VNFSSVGPVAVPSGRDVSIEMLAESLPLLPPSCPQYNKDRYIYYGYALA